jgi:hypothetical protein
MSPNGSYYVLGTATPLPGAGGTDARGGLYDFSVTVVLRSGSYRFFPDGYGANAANYIYFVYSADTGRSAPISNSEVTIAATGVVATGRKRK